MSDYDNTNRGVMFKERDKKNEKGPDYSGTLNVGGTDYRIAAWIREGKSGMKFLSLAVEPKKEAKTKPADDDLDSSIPF